MTTKYKNSPIIETICEFHYIPKEPWDATVPGMIYEGVKEEFPIKKQREDGYIADLLGGGLTTFTQFYTENKESLIQVGKNILTINCLKPYPHWEIFKPMILKNSGIYNKIISPVSLKQLSLRYINKIDIPVNDGETLSLKDYFNYYPYTCEQLKGIMSIIDVKVHLPSQNKTNELISD